MTKDRRYIFILYLAPSDIGDLQCFFFIKNITFKPSMYLLMQKHGGLKDLLNLSAGLKLRVRGVPIGLILQLTR